MKNLSIALNAALIAMLMASVAGGAQGPPSTIRPGAKLFVTGMPDGFDTYFKSALEKKKVPVVVVPTREEAEFEVKGTSETQKASVAKKIFRGSWRSDEQASISVINIASGEIAFAYSVNKKDSAHGKRSSAESCAKHLKEHIEGKK